MSWSDDATLPAPRRAPAVHYGGPERLFGVTSLAVDGAVATGSMEIDTPHASSTGCGGGAIAVLVDDALGYAIVTASPEERWSVSTDITLDLLAPLSPGTTVTAAARAVYVDASTSIAECRVHDGSGRLVALATQRGRFTPPPPDPGGEDDAADTAVASAIARGASAGLAALIGARPVGRTTTRVRPRAATIDDRGRAPEAASSTFELVATAELGNRFGALHGGVALAASLLAAEAELERAGSGALAPTSIRITYPRPITAGAVARFRATARHAGRSFAVLDVTAEVDGRLCTSAQVTAHPFSL